MNQNVKALINLPARLSMKKRTEVITAISFNSTIFNS